MKAITNFCVYINQNRNDFISFMNLCKKYNIKVDDRWSGSGTFYGIKSNKYWCSSSKWGTTFDIKSFSTYLINFKPNNNEQIRTINTDIRSEEGKRGISSSSKRQIATSSKYSGNSTSVRVKETRIRRGQISASAISC